MKKIGIILAGIVLVIALVFSSTYNSLVSQEEDVDSGWAQVENVYQRRADLIPNLVSTVKGYAAHESATLQAVIGARKQAQMTVSKDVLNDPQAFKKFEAAQGAVSSALSRLLVTVERYPDLKANQNFLALQSQLEGTENRIAVERNRFNTTAKTYNTTLRRFPSNVVGRILGFDRKTYFQAAAGADKAPTVSF